MNIEKIVKHLEIGQTVILKLNEDIVVGELIVKKLPSHLRLKNCRDYATNEELGVNNIYYINEIRDIRVTHDPNKEKETFDVTPVSTEENEDAKKTQKKICIKLRDDKLNKIREMLNTRVYIDRYDAKYFGACKDMLSNRQIGICLEDVRYGRRSKGSILAVSTDTRIYIFDLLLLDGIKKELKDVLESTSVCKVVHYSKMSYDYLQHACNIKTHFIFDTLMAYFYVSGSREVLTVTELISKLFNLPQVEPSDNVIWDNRPISEETLSQAGFSVAFLIEIQQYLMHRHLLRSFYEASAAAMCQLSNSDEFPYAIKSVHGKEIVKGLMVDTSQDNPVDLRESKTVELKEEKNEETVSNTSKASSD